MYASKRDTDLGDCGQREGDRTGRRLLPESDKGQRKELALGFHLQAEDMRGHYKVTVCRSLKGFCGTG